MALSHPDRWPRARLAALALAATAFLPAEAYVAVCREEITVTGNNPVGNLSEGKLTLRDVALAQKCSSTVIKAQQTTVTGVSEGYQNSRWEFRGKVHIEFDGAIVDADNAVAVFADSQIKSIVVRGAPAQFSHLAKGSTTQRNQGRANNIDFDPARREVRFAGKAWYSDGRNEASTEQLTYNLDDRAITSTGDGTGDSTFNLTIRPDKRITLPRAPERGTAE